MRTGFPFNSFMASAASSGAEKRRKPVHLLAPVAWSTKTLLDTTLPNPCAREPGHVQALTPTFIVLAAVLAERGIASHAVDSQQGRSEVSSEF